MPVLRLVLLLLSAGAALPAGASVAASSQPGDALRPRVAFSGSDRQTTDWWFRRNAGAIKRWYDPAGKLPAKVDRELAPNDSLPKALPQAYLPWGLERLLSPLPPDLERVIVGRHVLLLDRRTGIVLDVMREVVR
jgi:hypothetical protein